MVGFFCVQKFSNVTKPGSGGIRFATYDTNNWSVMIAKLIFSHARSELVVYSYDTCKPNIFPLRVRESGFIRMTKKCG
jgi:hypothetical protein